MESHWQHHRAGPGNATGGEIRDKRDIVQVCVTPEAARMQLCQYLRNSFLCSFQKFHLQAPVTCSQFLVGLGLALSPSALRYPGSAAALPV